MTDTDTAEPNVQAWPYTDMGLRVTVPVEVELPPEVVNHCRLHYTMACDDGHDPAFKDYLWNLLDIEPTFTVDGEEIDMDTGLKVD